MDELSKYIAYQGKVYTIEFYYDGKGKSPTKEYMLKNFSASDAKKFEHLLMMMEDGGQIRNKEKFRNEGDKVYISHSHIVFYVFSLMGIK